WRQWLDFAGVNGVDPSRGPVLNQASMAIDAAVDGQGIALARTALAAWDLIGGRLVRPFDIPMPVSYAYWIVCSKVVARLPKIVAFSEWLLAEAAEDAPQLDRLKAKARQARRVTHLSRCFRQQPPPGARYALPAKHKGVILSRAGSEGAGAMASTCRSAESCATPLDLNYTYSRG